MRKYEWIRDVNVVWRIQNGILGKAMAPVAVGKTIVGRYYVHTCRNNVWMNVFLHIANTDYSLWKKKWVTFDKFVLKMNKGVDARLWKKMILRHTRILTIRPILLRKPTIEERGPNMSIDFDEAILHKGVIIKSQTLFEFVRENFLRDGSTPIRQIYCEYYHEPPNPDDPEDDWTCTTPIESIALLLAYQVKKRGYHTLVKRLQKMYNIPDKYLVGQ